MTKNLYVTPETEVLEVRFEENIMSGPFSAQGTEHGNNRSNEGGEYFFE